jgi:hypothetical protein
MMIILLPARVFSASRATISSARCCCLHFSEGRVWQFTGLLVQYGHLSAFGVKVIARHFGDTRGSEFAGHGRAYAIESLLGGADKDHEGHERWYRSLVLRGRT